MDKTLDPPSWTVAGAPCRLPFFGHSIVLRRAPLEFLTSLYEHGDLVTLRFGRRRIYMACHQDLIDRILKDPRTFDRGGPFYEKTQLLMGNSLGNCPYHDHRRQRRLVQPSFRLDRIASYATVMREELESEIRSWRPGGTVEVNDLLHAVAARVGAKVLLSTDIARDAVRRILRWLPVVMDGIYKRTVTPWSGLYKLPTPSSRRFEAARAQLYQVVDQIVKEYRKVGIDHGDLLSGLLTSRDDRTGDALTDREIHDMVMNFFFAATETTATALAWALYLLGENPGCEQRLHAEVDRLIGDRPVAHGDLGALAYTGRVITETLRLYPPGWMVTRVVTEETELARQRLPVGSIVMYSSYALQRSPRLFPDPERFDPDRWLPERAQEIPHGAMIPFGSGSRKCIGDNFAMVETTLALATIAARWRLRLVPGTRVRPEPRALVAMGPLPMVTEPRRSQPVDQTTNVA